MRAYNLATPKDDHGQPIRLFKANLENNTTKAIDQLSGICAGILADGEVNDEEAKFFGEWVRQYAPYEPVWPFTDILARVERIFADGNCDDEEREELRMVMEELCGHVQGSASNETYSTSLPLNSPAPDPIVFPQRVFAITGKFAFGARRKVVEAIESLGGVASDSAPTRESNYLVIGVFASRDWAHTNYGRKIERAVELRESGSGLVIVSEEHWKKFVS